jgi:hypothetical protein
MEALRVVGQPVARRDGGDIVAGNVAYGVDVVLPLPTCFTRRSCDTIKS